MKKFYVSTDINGRKTSYWIVNENNVRRIWIDSDGFPIGGWFTSSFTPEKVWYMERTEEISKYEAAFLFDI